MQSASCDLFLHSPRFKSMKFIYSSPHNNIFRLAQSKNSGVRQPPVFLRIIKPLIKFGSFSALNTKIKSTYLQLEGCWIPVVFVKTFFICPVRINTIYCFRDIFIARINFHMASFPLSSSLLLDLLQRKQGELFRCGEN